MRITRPALAQSVDTILYVIQQIMSVFSQFFAFIDQIIKFISSHFGG